MKAHSLIVSFVLLFLSILFSSRSFAQDAPMKWGEIPKEDLAMKSWPSDTNVSAVYLCDYARSEFTNELAISFKKHTRIKILTEKGYELGTQSIVFHSKSGNEKIKDVEGATYTLNADGTVTKKELLKDDIFKEKINDEYTKIKFTLPSLTPGCVIEFRYEEVIDSWLLFPSWDFQHSEPVRWSEYRAIVPINFVYTALDHGYEKFSVKEVTPVTQKFLGDAANAMGLAPVKCSQIRYVIENVPALRDEPYITTLEDYRSRVSMQLSEYYFPGPGEKKVLNTWPTFVSDLMKNRDFYKKIDNTRAMRKIVDTLLAGITQPEEKMIAVYNWIAKTIVVSGENNVFATQDINDILDSKKGNDAEISFLLISMLRYAGIQCDPVILSTRSHGHLQKLYPIVEQFNYVLTRAIIGTQQYFLDATDPLRTYDLLPTRVLGVAGIVIKPDPVEWVNITSDKKVIENATGIVEVNSDGTIQGKFMDAFRQYGSLFNRRFLHENKDIETAKHIFGIGESGIQIDSVNIKGKDSLNAPLVVVAGVSSSTYAQAAGDMIYLNPHVINRIKENPFKSEHRAFPIDYAYRREETNSVVIVLPDNFEIKDKLLDRSFTAAEGALSFSRQSQQTGNRLQILYKLSIKETEITSDYYNLVKDFYNKIVAIESEQLVLSLHKPVPAEVAPKAPEAAKEEIVIPPGTPSMLDKGVKKKSKK